MHTIIPTIPETDEERAKLLAPENYTPSGTVEMFYEDDDAEMYLLEPSDQQDFDASWHADKKETGVGVLLQNDWPTLFGKILIVPK